MEHKISIDELLEMIYQEGELCFRIQDIEYFKEFHILKEKVSLENVERNLLGIPPVMLIEFNEIKLADWCKKHNLLFNIDKCERAVFFKKPIIKDLGWGRSNSGRMIDEGR